MNHYESKCFLCNCNSTESETDHGHRFFVMCSNESCGNYEIVQDIAEARLSEDMKTSLQKIVNNYTSPMFKPCDIHRNTIGEVTITYGQAIKEQ